MSAGITRDNISLDLIDPRTLEITCARKNVVTDENGRYCLRERTFESMTQEVSLPKPVTDERSSAAFRNGVLEVHLKKITKESQGKIPVD
jgi:HSP20 family protein